MPAKKKGTARILPTPSADDPWPAYEHNGGWRFITVGATGTKVPSKTFASRAIAAKERQEEQRQLDGVSDLSTGEARDLFELYQRSGEDGAPNRPRTIEMYRYYIGLMMPDRDEALAAWGDAEHCKKAYTDLRTRISPATGKPYTADTHRNALMNTGIFLRWCVGRKYLPLTKIGEVKGWGARHKRKRQPKIDEQLKFIDEALYQARKGQHGPVAALIALMVGLREQSITKRRVGDVDARGTVLIVDEAKTRESEGRYQIPEELQPFIRQIIAGRAEDEPLWIQRGKRLGASKGWVRKWIKRLCRWARIPEYTAHDMRRGSGTAAMLGGLRDAEERARKKLRHKDWSTTTGYVADSALAEVAQDSALKVWRGN